MISSNVLKLIVLSCNCYKCDNLSDALICRDAMLSCISNDKKILLPSQVKYYEQNDFGLSGIFSLLVFLKNIYFFLGTSVFYGKTCLLELVYDVK